MELAPLNPHTTSRTSRDCSDCHGSQVAMGYGMDGGVYDSEPQTTRYADVVTADRENVSRFTKAQISAIKDLHGDFMQPLTVPQRDRLARAGTCMACHQDIPDGSIPMEMLGKVAKVANLSFAPADDHAHLLRENNILIAWIKLIAIFAGILAIPVIGICYAKRKAIQTWIHKVTG